MLMMFRIPSRHRTKILLLGVALVVVITATAVTQITLNAWNRPFYDALSHKDLHGSLSSSQFSSSSPAPSWS
jgi:putative ATP-binding cassette transporter